MLVALSLRRRRAHLLAKQISEGSTERCRRGPAPSSEIRDIDRPAPPQENRLIPLSIPAALVCLPRLAGTMNHDHRVLARSFRNLKADIPLVNWENLAGIAAQIADVEISRRRDVIEAEIETPLPYKRDRLFVGVHEN